MKNKILELMPVQFLSAKELIRQYDNLDDYSPRRIFDVGFEVSNRADRLPFRLRFWRFGVAYEQSQIFGWRRLFWRYYWKKGVWIASEGRSAGFYSEDTGITFVPYDQAETEEESQEEV